jgi:hypothetical protein
LHGEGHELRLQNPKDPIRNILRIAGLEGVIAIE